MKPVQVIEERRLIDKANAVAKTYEGFFDDHRVADKALRNDDKSAGKRTNANNTVTWIYHDERR